MYLPTLLLWMDSIALIPSSTHSMEPLQLAFYVLQADCLQVGEVVHYSSCSLILGWVIYHFNTQILMIVFSPFQKREKKEKKKSPSSAGVIVPSFTERNLFLAGELRSLLRPSGIKLSSLFMLSRNGWGSYEVGELWLCSPGERKSSKTMTQSR